MEPFSLLRRARGKAYRLLASNFCRRDVEVALPSPIVSFTFDDAPSSAVTLGGDVLKEFGALATYYVSLGLVGSETEVGRIASVDELAAAVAAGDELGCHTYDHYDAWHTAPKTYLASVARNSAALKQIVPGGEFRTFAYPKSGATLGVKPALTRLFRCCRGGGQSFNAGVTDLNLLNACFLDSWMGVDLDSAKRLIDANAAHGGWLIFATHDVADSPTRYGCTPRLLREVAAYAQASGAALLPVTQACDVVEGSCSGTAA